MPNIMSRTDWLKLTDGGRLSIRSSELKSVDKALEAYEKQKTEANLDLLRSALVAWIQSKGPDWKKSVRNRHGAVDTLFRQLMGIEGPKKSGDDIVALSHIRAESRAIVTDLFRGAELEWRSGFFRKVNARTRVEKANFVNDAINNDIVENIVKNICKLIIPEDKFPDVFALILQQMPTFLVDFAAEIAPFVGVITSGGKTLKSGVEVAIKQYGVCSAGRHLKGSLSVEEPRLAIEAMIGILRGERKEKAMEFGIEAVGFAGKLGTLLADGGAATNTIIGVASTLANLAIFVRAFVNDYRERNSVNKLLAAGGSLQAAVLFETSPLTGAYLICCVPTSVMVNSIFDRFYNLGWQGDVEYAVRNHIEPLRQEAVRIIRDSRLWIPKLQNYPGLVEKNSEKLREMARRRGKTGMMGIGPDVERFDRLTPQPGP